MGWTMWLLLGVSLAGLYVLGLIGYRIYLNVSGLKTEVLKAQSLVAEAQNFEPLEITRAKANDSDDLAQVLLNRRRIQREKQERREARQHRLVQRISEIEIDKR